MTKNVGGFKPVINMETSYLNKDVFKFQSSQKKQKAEPSGLIPLKVKAGLELLTVCFLLL